jgi:hypothetical protein
MFSFVSAKNYYLNFFISVVLITTFMGCSEGSNQSAELEKERQKLREEREALERQKRQKEIADSIAAETMRLLDESIYPISNAELIKLFNITNSSLGNEFVNEMEPSRKPSYQIIGKQFYTIGTKNYLLAVMGITNPNDFHFASGKQVVALFLYEADRWNRIDMMRNVSVTSGFGNYGGFEKFHMFGNKNVAVSLDGGFMAQGNFEEHRTIVGVIDEKLYEVYTAQKTFNDEGAMGNQDDNTTVSFQKIDDGFYELKEVKNSKGSAPQTRVLSFNTNKMKYQ